MQQHAVEIAEDQDGPCLVCACGYEGSGSTWEEAGHNIDEHIYDAYNPRLTTQTAGGEG